MRSICSPVHGVVRSVLVVAHLVAQQHDHAAAPYAVERGAWAEAAALVPQPSRYLYADALTYFAKALGAARTGNLVTARAAIDSLRALADRLEEQKEIYWAGRRRPRCPAIVRKPHGITGSC